METHLDRKRVLGFRQVVTEQAVERREHRRAFRTGRTFPKNAPELPESQVERTVYERGYPADAAVHGSAEQPRRCAADGAVDRLDEIGYALRRFDYELAHTAEIVDVLPPPVGHGLDVAQSSACRIVSDPNAIPAGHSNFDPASRFSSRRYSRCESG